MYSALESVLIAAAVILAYIIIRIKSEKAGAKKEYERMAGRPLKIGTDPIPKWVAKELWEAMAVIPILERGGGHTGKMIFICRSIVATGNPQRVTLEVLPNQRIPAKEEAFNISQKGKIEFDLQPTI